MLHSKIETNKKPWKKPILRALQGAEAERARQMLIERGLIPGETGKPNAGSK